MSLIETMTPDMWARFKALDNITLTYGAHKSLQEGACVMELASHIAGEDWGDHPRCVDPVLAAACRCANDRGPDWVKRALYDRIPYLIGSANGDELAIKRSKVFAQFVIYEIELLVHQTGRYDNEYITTSFTNICNAIIVAYNVICSVEGCIGDASNVAAYSVTAVVTATCCVQYDIDQPWKMFIAALDRAIAIK